MHLRSKQQQKLSRGISRPPLFYQELRRGIAAQMRGRSHDFFEIQKIGNDLRFPEPTLGEITAARRQLRAIAGAKNPRPVGHNNSICPYRPLMIFYQGRSRRELEALGLE